MPGEVLQLAGPTQTLARTHGSGLAPVASGRIETSITFSGAPGIGPDGPATKEPAAATPSISLSIDSTEKRGISGWAWCGSDSTEPCTVELWADGVRRAAARADRFRADLLAAGIGTGIAGFDLPIPDSVLLRGRELRLVAHHPDAESVEWFSRVPSLRKATVWTDFSDLLQYLRDNRLPTGIQRVQIEIARAAVAAGPGEFHHKAVAFDEIRRFWYEVDHRRILDLVDTAGDTGVAAATWEASYAQFEAAVPGMPLAAFVPGDFLLNIGSSWWLPDYMLYVRTLQEERGVQYVPFVHDCIPMITPQFCSAGLVEDFERWFREVLDAAPFFLVNSDCTRRDLLRFADALGFGQRSATTIRLDGRSGAGDPAAADTSGPGADLARARLGVSRPYVLFVATLDPAS